MSIIYEESVNAALQDQLPEMPSRTVRHRFLRATGLTQSHIRQVEFVRAEHRLSACARQRSSAAKTCTILGLTRRSCPCGG